MFDIDFINWRVFYFLYIFFVQKIVYAQEFIIIVFFYIFIQNLFAQEKNIGQDQGT